MVDSINNYQTSHCSKFWDPNKDDCAAYSWTKILEPETLQQSERSVLGKVIWLTKVYALYFRYILHFFQPYFLFNNACTNLCLRSTQSHICLTINMCFVLNLHSYFKCLLLSLLKYQSSTINVILAPVWTPFIFEILGASQICAKLPEREKT